MRYRNHYIFIITLLIFSLVSCHSIENSNKTQTESITQNLDELSAGFVNPDTKYRPETWFHLIGNNISKDGLTADLEAIESAGLQGIHLFNKSGGPYPDVEPIKILSPEWEDMIRHAADECQRLGLKFTMQNCPGWSMTGGPWVPVEEAQREVVETTYRVNGGTDFIGYLELDSLYKTVDYDYKDMLDHQLSRTPIMIMKSCHGKKFLILHQK